MFLRRFVSVVCAVVVVVLPAVTLGVPASGAGAREVAQRAAQPTYPYRYVPTPGQEVQMVVRSWGRDCLDLENVTGPYLLHWQCHHQVNQQWVLVDGGGGYWQIRPLGYPSDCVDVEGVTGPGVLRWPCHGGDNQLWDIWVERESVARISPKSDLTTCLTTVVAGSRVLVSSECQDRQDRRWIVPA